MAARDNKIEYTGITVIFSPFYKVITIYLELNIRLQPYIRYNFYGYNLMKQSTYYGILTNIEEKYTEIWKMKHFPLQKSNWIKHLRTGLGMSLRQLGNKLDMKPPSVKEVEQREVEGTITINTLRQTANAFDMDLFYMFVPRAKYKTGNHPLKQLLKDRAYEVAKQIVERTSTTMMLENQSISKKKIDEQIQLLAQKIESEMPRYLWD